MIVNKIAVHDSEQNESAHAMMKRTISTLCLISLLAACGGRTPSPVMISQYGDQQKSCKALEFEMTNIQGDIQRIMPDRDKTGQNVALGVAGAFFLVPWFFMDFKNAEATEYEALRQRYNHLGSVAIDKRCGVKPIDLPSVQQMKEQYEREQAKKNAPKNNQ